MYNYNIMSSERHSGMRVFDHVSLMTPPIVSLPFGEIKDNRAKLPAYFWDVEKIEDLEKMPTLNEID